MVRRHCRRRSMIRTSCRSAGWPRWSRSRSRAGWPTWSPRSSRSRPRAGSTRRSRCRPWWPGWSPARTRSRTWNRGHGPAPARRHGPAVRRPPGPVDVGHVPARVHLRPRPPARLGGRGILDALATSTPLLPGAGQVTFLDLDDTRRETHGYAKQGAGYGYTKIKGLNALLATICTPTAAPLIAAARLRKGAVNSARGAGKLVAEALTTARACGAGGSDRTGLVLARADSAFYCHDMVAAARRGGACFSITARMNPAVQRAIAAIGEDAWIPIRYPRAVWDDEGQCWISDAEVAEIEFTAFTSRPKTDHITARLIVRRVKRLNPASVPAGQGELFTTWRHHAVFTDSPQPMLQAETTHRQHAVIEQANADLKAGPLAHLPSGKFAANSAWPALAAIAFNLTRAAGALSSQFHARATTGTVRTQLINIPARLARSARRLRLHLPRDWPWEQAFIQLFDATCGHRQPPERQTAHRARPETDSGRAGQTGGSTTARFDHQDHVTLWREQPRSAVDRGSADRAGASGLRADGGSAATDRRVQPARHGQDAGRQAASRRRRPDPAGRRRAGRAARRMDRRPPLPRPGRPRPLPAPTGQ